MTEADHARPLERLALRFTEHRRTVAPRRLHLCPARHRRRGGGRHLGWRSDSPAGDGHLGKGILVPDPVHHADGTHRHHRHRGGDRGPRSPPDRSRWRHPARESISRRVRCRDGHAHRLDQLGIQPRLLGRARARDRAAAVRGGLSHARRVRTPGTRKRVGAGAERIRRAADGHAREPARGHSPCGRERRDRRTARGRNHPAHAIPSSSGSRSSRSPWRSSWSRS